MALYRHFLSESCPNILITAKEVMVDRLAEHFNVLQYAGELQMPRNLLMQHLPRTDGLVCLVRDKIDSELLDAAKHLKVISTMSVGTDHIDLKECEKRGISVASTPDVLTESVAETAVALLLAAARRLPEAIYEAKSGRWSTWSPYYMCGVGIKDSTVGIIGLGRIGFSVAEKLKAFHPARIVYHNRKPNEQKASLLGATYVPLEQLLKQSDFVIITCSASEENKNMISKETLSLMKNDAVLVNTSRGSLINQDDLFTALASKQIRAAGLDVTTPEPLPPDHPLFKLENCVILPHIASATYKTRTAMMQMAENAVIRMLSSTKVTHEHF